MARAKWLVGLSVMVAATLMGGCAATDHGFSRQKVAEWSMRSEHERQLQRVLRDPWTAEVATPEPAPTTIGIW